jgi:hypothetical protein
MPVAFHNPAQFVQVRLDFTTDGSGAATVTAEDTYIGTLYAIQMIDGTLDDGVDITLTCEQGELSIPLLVAADWNTDKMIYPRVLQNLNTDGTALTSHTEPMICGKPKAVIAQGGATKTGAVILYIR